MKKKTTTNFRIHSPELTRNKSQLIRNPQLPVHLSLDSCEWGRNKAANGRSHAQKTSLKFYHHKLPELDSQTRALLILISLILSRETELTRLGIKDLILCENNSLIVRRGRFPSRNRLHGEGEIEDSRELVATNGRKIIPFFRSFVFAFRSANY